MSGPLTSSVLGECSALEDEPKNDYPAQFHLLVRVVLEEFSLWLEILGLFVEFKQLKQRTDSV